MTHLTSDRSTQDSACLLLCHRPGAQLSDPRRLRRSRLAPLGYCTRKNSKALRRVWTSRHCRHFGVMRDAERRAPLPRVCCPRGSFARSISIANKGDWCCQWLDDFRHKHRILHHCPCVYALQETDKWTTSAMNVPGYIVYGNDHGRTTILCPREG